MINFADVQRSVQALKQQVENNQIDEKRFENRLLDLIDVAQDGYYWMYGHESNQWFRHDGEKWVPDDPSRLAAGQNQAPGSTGDETFYEESSSLENSPLSPVWFMISLVLLIVIGWIVYLSSLI